ncbi:MAG: hypothetical protein WCV67_18025 [Victivallaceae bacterium]
MLRIMKLLVIFAVFATAGCESLNLSWDDILGRSKSDSSSSESSSTGKYEPKYAMTFHQVVEYPRAENIEKEITTFDGKKLYINSNFFCSSREVMRAKMIERKDQKDFYDLALNLSRRGKMRWMNMVVNFQHSDIAIMLDGMYYRSFTPEVITDEDTEWVLLPGPFDPVTAKGIVKYAEKNYDYYNPDSRKSF